jgi:uncharacterized protein DUF4124
MILARNSLAAARRLSARAALSALAAGLLVAAGPASAVLYKWVDANGRVSYSDQPPPSNVKAEIVGAAPPPASPDAVRVMASQEADLKKRQAQRADDQKKAEKARADAALQQQACTEAKGRIRIYESDQLITRINEKGEQVYIDEATRAKERERLQAEIRERCAG